MNEPITTTASRRNLLRRVLIGGLALTALALTAAIMLPPASRTAHAANQQANSSSSGGGGGGCFSSAGPVCTFKDMSANAVFESSAACTVTDVFVFATQSLTHNQPGAATSGADIEAAIFQYPLCPGTPTIDGYSQGFTGTVQAANNGSTLTASGTVSVFDFNAQSTITLTVNLTWTGLGPSSQYVDSVHYRSPGYIFNSHFTGTSRAAVASGTLSDGTTNYAASPALDAGLMSASGGTIQVIQQ